jgi:hypothetical protein
VHAVHDVHVPATVVAEPELYKPAVQPVGTVGAVPAAVNNVVDVAQGVAALVRSVAQKYVANGHVHFVTNVVVVTGGPPDVAAEAGATAAQPAVAGQINKRFPVATARPGVA